MSDILDELEGKKEEEPPKNKQILFQHNDHIHAKFKIRCEHEGITQSSFFRLMMDKLLKDDKRMLSILDDWKDEQDSVTKRKRAEIEKERARRDKFEEEFGISEDEIMDMYELFDEE